jgi:hypothetical protein
MLGAAYWGYHNNIKCSVTKTRYLRSTHNLTGKCRRQTVAKGYILPGENSLEVGGSLLAIASIKMDDPDNAKNTVALQKLKPCAKAWAYSIKAVSKRTPWHDEKLFSQPWQKIYWTVTNRK